MMFAQQQGTGLQITKLLIQDTGTYNPQWRRPYQTIATDRELKMFAERLDGMNTITAPALSGVAGQFIAPSAIPEKKLEIPNDWGSRRLRFMMEAQTQDMHGSVLTEVILGYTDHPGVIVHPTSAVLDPNMRFYINSIVKVRSVNRNTPLGLENHTSIKDNSHLLYQDAWPGALAATQDMRMRPSDLFATMGIAHLPDSGEIADSRVYQHSAAFSKRENGLPTQYVARTLQSYKTAMGTEALGQTEHDVRSQARGYASEENATRDSFLSAMSQIQGMPPSNVFTWRELLALQPTVDNLTNVVMMGGTEKMQAHEAGLTADWGAAEIETVVATSLSNSIPALMMEFAITKLAFISTNHNINGQISTVIADVHGFSNIDMSPAVNLFIQKMESTVLADLSMNNEVGFSVQMKVDLMGETWIKLAYSGNPTVDFVTPSFCDALMVPVLTQNREHGLNVARDFDKLTSVVSSFQGPSFGSGQFRSSF